MPQVRIYLKCCIAFSLAVTGFAQQLPEKPVAIVLRGEGGEYVRQGNHAYLRMEPGEVLFTGDSFRTGSNPVTILHCLSRQVIDVPPHAAGVGSLTRLTTQHAPAVAARSVPECEMPASVRRKAAGEAHLGQSIYNSRILTVSDISNPATATEPGIARLLKQLAIAERARRDSEALTLSKILFSLWPGAAWLRIKVFNYGRAVAAHEQPPVILPGSSAILIGISNYKDPTVPSIHWADQDALMIRRYLKSERGGSLPDDRIVMLLNEQATGAAIRAAFDRILIQRTSTVLIFIAAHGFQGYIANYDIDHQNPRDKGVALKEVNELIATGLSGVKTIFAYVDTCNSGYLQGLNSSGLQAPEGGRLFGFAASRTGESSYEYRELGGGHGVFSWFLDQALTAAGPQTAAVSTIKQTVGYVQNKVANYVKKKQGMEQHPVDFGNYEYDAPLVNFSLPGPAPEPDTPPIVVGETARTGVRNLDPRLGYEDAGEVIVSRYLEGEADPLTRADFEGAAESFDEAYGLAPESVWLESRSEFAHGRVLVFDKRYDEAIRRLNRAIQLDPAGAIAYNALGIAYLEEPDYPRALAAFEDAASRAPRWAYAWHNEALAEIQMGNYRGAIDSYKHAIEVAPQEASYYYLPYNLGALYQSLNRLRDAELQYKKAGSQAPTRGEPDNALGTIRAVQGKETEARRLFELALQKDPTLEIARKNLSALQQPAPKKP